jgi:hypothetical protein
MGPADGPTRQRGLILSSHRLRPAGASLISSMAFIVVVQPSGIWGRDDAERSVSDVHSVATKPHRCVIVATPLS